MLFFNHQSKPRVLFILKQREVMYEGETEAEGQYSGGLLHSGLFNSANFMNTMLRENGYDSHIVHAIDNNCIDREVTSFKPDVVIIEAYWVVPEKFDVLTKLHPKVSWVIRNHSKTPFLANEGIAYDWTMKYAERPNVYISSNSIKTSQEMAHLVAAKLKCTMVEAKEKCPFLPNYYPIKLDEAMPEDGERNDDVVNISCFGAIRPLKNHMIQAVAAIMYANAAGKKLRFHINCNRIEGSGGNVLKNLRSLFSHLEHELVEHPWQPHDKFLALVATMDIGMQVSYTETFNIVAADHIRMGVPVIASKEIDWIDSKFHADPNDAEEMARILFETMHSRKTHSHGWMPSRTLRNLEEYNASTLKIWSAELEKLKKKRA